jgi:hypothetical protein
MLIASLLLAATSGAGLLGCAPRYAVPPPGWQKQPPPLSESLMTPTSVYKNTCPGHPPMVPVVFNAYHIGPDPVSVAVPPDSDGHIHLIARHQEGACSVATFVIITKPTDSPTPPAAMGQVRTCDGSQCAWTVMGSWE